MSYEQLIDEMRKDSIQRDFRKGENGPRIFTIELRQDDPTKCTSAKMARLHLATPIRESQIPHDSIVLNPFSQVTLLPSDRSSVERHGVVVVDCSWVKASNIFLSRRFNRGFQRRLPALMAGNPTNYSKLQSLSSVEAAAAALYITGFTERANKLLSIYKWGETFLSLNRGALDDYAKAASAEQLSEIESAYFRSASI